jgi:glycerol kinase
MSQFILSIDQGTTSSRAIVFDQQGLPVASSQQEFTQIFPADGWVEHDAMEIWQGVVTVCREALVKANIEASQVASIGITNQRETTVIWDRASGKPIHNAIVWQDRRTADFCASLKKADCEESVASKTGLLLDPYFSATKIKWLLDSVEGARARAEAGELAFGTIDTWLLWQLTNGASHKTDATNASRTLLFNIHTQQWDDHLLELFDVPRSLLPQVEDSSADFGLTNEALFGHAIPVGGMAGDQQAALIGQACFEPGMAKSTYGTGCFLMMNTGAEALKSEHRLLTTVAYRINGQTSYAIEGSIFVAGAAIQWLRDGIQLIQHANESEPLAKEMGIDNSVYLVPAFTGLGAPYWDPNARGAIMGLTRDTGIKEIVTAGLQSVCYQTADLMLAMQKDGAKPKSLRVDGGMVVNNWVVQFLSDVLDVAIERPQVTETTALGAAYLAGLQVGIFKDLNDISKLWHKEAGFESQMDSLMRDRLYDGWKDAVNRVRTEGMPL